MDKTKKFRRTGLDLSREKIIQISLVVKDTEKVAKRFSEIFGVSWKLYDLMPKHVVLNDRLMDEADGCLKIAIGAFGGRSLKLIQPVSGHSSYADFLKKYGEGFYAIGLGTLANHDEVVRTLAKAGVRIEMQGELGNGARFSILRTVEDLGCRLELCSPADQANESYLTPTGTLVPACASFVNLDKPSFSGGKKINQIGIVLKDERQAAERFEELLGIGDWSYSFGPPGLTNTSLNGKPVPESEMKALDVAFANGWLGDIQIELIRPIGVRPGGCHQWFLDRMGNGIQHLSFGLQADYAEVVDGMNRAGILTEFSASLKMGPSSGVSVSYFATQSQMGGFQLEILGPVEF